MLAVLGGGLERGLLVELHGLPEPLDADDVVAPAGLEEPVLANGQVGKLLDVDFRSGKHVVKLFAGTILLAPESCVRPYGAAAPPGCHAVWPIAGAADAARCAAQAVEALTLHDHCVVQMFISEESGREAFQEALSPLVNYKSMRREVEPAYLGRSASCKAAWLEGLAEEKAQVTSELDKLDILLSQFTRFTVPLAPVALDFMTYSRTNGLVRMPFQSSTEESRMQPYEVDEDDIAEGLLDEHVAFLKRRQLCMMLICSSEGGELTLFPKDEERETVTVETRQGQLVVFRHDRMSYHYRAASARDLVLQAWVMTEPPNFESVKIEGMDPAFRDEAIGLRTGPRTPEGLRIDALGISVMFPGGGEVQEAFWATCSAGTDGVIKTPFNRFDMDLYHLNADVWQPGATYTTHAGYMIADIYALDNVFFGISEDEASVMQPAQRCLLEKGYEALFKSGLRRATLKGRAVGIFCGHSGDDWTMMQAELVGDDARRMKYCLQTRIWSAITGKLMHAFGMTGPQSLVDTACSSALVAYSVGHTMLRKRETSQTSMGVDAHLDEALMMGANIIPGPGNFINLCGPHMLSIKGRCFTFDHSADGFGRGEGCGAFFVRNQMARTEETTCTMIGSCTNQDGRSASMTAPNGPAQQECIRGSMREAGLRASEVTCAELHGTGTALGDPIEVGSLKGVMQDRLVPLMQSSAKTHIGHLEASAGCAGVIKCMLMCAACAGSPNCHLADLNPHLDITGYPTVIATELSDYGANSGYSGVSSFGFGGANARADVFACATFGPHATGPIDIKQLDYITITCPFDEGPMHYLDGKVVPTTASVVHRHGPYHVDAIRDEFASYDYNSSLYKGPYQVNPPDEDLFVEAPAEPIYVLGSWDLFRRPLQMEGGEGDADGVYSVLVTLGETRCERFHLRVDKDPFRAIFPIVPNGSMHTRVVGPDEVVEGHHWLIDGRDDEVPAGTVYRITLRWGERPSVRWERVDDDPPEWCLKLKKHTYGIVGSWTAWEVEPMLDASTPSSRHTWQLRFRLGLTGTESFRFLRDCDEQQAIYPMRDRGGDDVPICGPDEFCDGRNFKVEGSPGDIVAATLQLVDAHVVVTVALPGSGKRELHSVEGPSRHNWHISGSFTGMRYKEMATDERMPGVFRYSGVVGPTGEEQFHIAMDARPGLRLFPEVPGAYPGESIVRGPGKAEEDHTFSLFALIPGARFEIVLDRRKADRRKVVDITWQSERCDFDSMQAAAFQFVSGVPGLAD